MAHETWVTEDESRSSRGWLTLVKRRTMAIIPVALAAAPGAAFQDGARALQRDVPTRDVRLEAGLIRTGGGNWHTLTHTNRYAVIVTSSGNARYARRQPGRILLYSCGTNMPPDSTSASCGVSYADAVANNWILKDASGNYVRYRGRYPVLLDIGNPWYQQRFISDIDANLRSHPGVDGVFIDDVTGNLMGGGTVIPARYRDNASYRAAMLSFVKAVGSALKAKGWYVTVNASIVDGTIESATGPSWDGSQYIWWVNRIGQYVNGINMEHWQQNWDGSASVRVSGSAGNQAWQGWQRVPSAVHALRRDFYAMDAGALTDVKKAAYLRASFLLASRPGRGPSSTPTTTPETEILGALWLHPESAGHWKEHVRSASAFGVPSRAVPSSSIPARRNRRPSRSSVGTCCPMGTR